MTGTGRAGLVALAPAFLAIACAGAGRPDADVADSSVDHGPADARAVAEIRRTWDDYMGERRGYYHRCWIPSRFWREEEQEAWPCFDLAHSLVPFGMEPTGVDVEPATDGEYRVRTSFAWQDQSDAASAWGDGMTTTVYAVRKDDVWSFSNALLRSTASWERVTMGPITYVLEPGIALDRGRAARAVAFNDSIARLFEVPPLSPTTYFVTSSLDSAYGAAGAELDVTLGASGAFARPVNFQIFSSIPDHGHELVHLLLAPLQTETTSVWASEGVATWLGGTTGLGYHDAVRRLRTSLDANPDATLDAILTSDAYTNGERYPAAAVLAEMAYEQAGVDGVRGFYVSGPDVAGLRAGMERILGRPWPEIRAAWRGRVLGDPGGRAGDEPVGGEGMTKT